MSYAIASLYYGLPLKVGDSYRASGRTEEVEEAIDLRIPGFESFYSGHAGVIPAVFGVDMEVHMDECDHHTELSKFRLQPTDEEKEEYELLFNALPSALKADLAVFGHPRVFLLWSTS